jgi:triacylglycerol lipase
MAMVPHSVEEPNPGIAYRGSMSSVPTLLVHGYLASPTTMLPLKWRLQRRGIERVYLTPLSVLCIQDVTTLAKQLADRVDAIRAETGAERVDIVGVSQGGYIGLWYVKKLGGAAHVRHFVALGCPFHGTWFGLAGVVLGLGWISKGLWQTFPSSRFLTALHADPLPAGFEMTTVAIPGDWVAPPESCKVEGAELRMAPTTRSPLPHQALILSAGCADITAELLTR